MSPRDLVHRALADAYRARGVEPPAIDYADLLPRDRRVRIEIVRRIEVLRDGFETTRLFDAWRCATVGELIEAVERAFTPGACGLCREPLVDGACIYCEAVRPRRAA